PFHPDRLAGRILGMGDVLTLVERAQEAFDEKQAAKMQEKLQKASFTLEDMLESMQQVQKMGPIGQVMGMIPGMGGMAKEAQAAVDRGDLRR
ncbi:signal recognition particle protein, partial [Klebsiella pneumoniae]|nr:signal recognition particle protein [Klebsiella pneumoniae]